MESKTQPNEWKLQKLLEQKDYCDLTNSEEELVIELISKNEYQLRRQLITESKKDASILIPAPLIIEKSSNRIVIPLYQAMIAIAATILVMLFIKFPYSEILPELESQEIRYVSVTDTIKEIEYVYDTIYKEVEKTKVVKEKVYVPKNQYVKVYETPHYESNKVLNAPSNFQKPNLQSIIDEVDGSETLAEETNKSISNFVMYRD